MSSQSSLLKASRPPGRVVDDAGELSEHGHAVVYVDGEYSLEETLSLLADRFDEVRDDLPESVGVWSRDGYHRHEDVSASWRRVLDNGDEERLSIFPRGPHLYEWSIKLSQWFDSSQISGVDSRGIVGSYETPSEALSAAVDYMQEVDSE